MTRTKTRTKKKTATKGAAPESGGGDSRAKLPEAPSAVFMETSAQILRITGSPEMKRGINELVSQAQKVGTSWFVKREFEVVLIAFYRAVALAIESLPDGNPSCPQLFQDLWQEIEPMMEMFYPGGPNLFPHLNEKMNEVYRGKYVTPVELLRSFQTHEEAAWAMFLGEEHFQDRSSCGVWDSKDGTCDCAPEPREHCRLKETCVRNREDFLASAETLSGANCAESPWFKANLPLMKDAQGKALLELIGKHPNHVGDLVIFWEVPDGWTLLTRDRCFRKLRDAHRKQLEVYMVRLPRRMNGGECLVRYKGDGEGFVGDLLDYTAKGARISVTSTYVRDGARVIISSKKYMRERRGKVLYHDNEDEHAFGVKLPVGGKKSRRSRTQLP
jgi:hypothetical protein